MAGLGRPAIIAAAGSHDLGATAMKSTSETSAAVAKLSGEIEPPSLSKQIDLGTASRDDLEALHSDLKTAEANTATFMPRYVALLKAERDRVESHGLSIRADKDTLSKVLDGIDRRHAQIMAFISRMLPARADYYRAYQNYVDVLIANFGIYKLINGELIFPARAVDRYNSAAHAMRVAAKRVNELEEERRVQQDAQQSGNTK